MKVFRRTAIVREAGVMFGYISRVAVGTLMIFLSRGNHTQVFEERDQEKRRMSTRVIIVQTIGCLARVVLAANANAA